MRARLPRMTVEQMQARRLELERILVTTNWTDDQADEYERLEHNLYQRLVRLPRQIDACRAKLARLEAMAA